LLSRERAGEKELTRQNVTKAKLQTTVKNCIEFCWFLNKPALLLKKVYLKD
jgi:hypothetical protein